VALIVLDASVVIAQFDEADAHHPAAADFFRDHPIDDLRLPASAYAEALVEPARAGRLDVARGALERLRVRIEPVTETMAEHAADLRARQRALRTPDALVLACGDVLNADAVVTADRRWRRFELVRVIG
jgi:predicted nucleic acid-binding protein